MFPPNVGNEMKRHLKKKDLDPKALLLIDNCPAHPSVDQLSTSHGKITALFLPKNTTSNCNTLMVDLLVFLRKSIVHNYCLCNFQLFA